MTEHVHVGSHADVLASGRILAVGGRIDDKDLHDEDRHILEDGRLVPVDSFGKDASNTVLTGDELKAKAAELGIEGRSGMSADELRSAIVEHETGEEG